MSAMQRSLPWAVSNTFVWVFTWYWGFGLGELAWRVEVDAGRERDCILEDGVGRGERTLGQVSRGAAQAQANTLVRQYLPGLAIYGLK